MIAPTELDAEAALTSGGHAVSAARRHLGLTDLRLLITPTNASEDGGGCQVVFRWSFPKGGLPSHVLPHEIGHVLFIRFLVPRTDEAQYAGDAPDWLDEMAAIAFDDESGVRLRRADARRLAGRGELIPIRRLLAMPHPEWGAAMARAGEADAGAPGSFSPRSTETPGFYATVRALFDLLLKKTGDERILLRLAKVAAARGDFATWFRTTLTERGAGTLEDIDAMLLEHAAALR